MTKCDQCAGWLPSAAACPNCGAAAAGPWGWLRTVAIAAGGAALSVTLSACYGVPCLHDGGEHIGAGWDPNLTMREDADDGEEGHATHGPRGDGSPDPAEAPPPCGCRDPDGD